ncbi:MAG: hypothetical protein NT175_10700 [Bacteroidetes bacterium]|nr:hypothetical protein [Bacteroidota bacterium]
MRKIIMLFIFTCLIVSCSTTKRLQDKTTNQNNISFKTENDGSSFDKAIVIEEKRESMGIDAEYEWLKQNYPGYKLKMQSLSFHNKKPYDILNIVTIEGEEKSIYFDISNFYGKF